VLPGEKEPEVAAPPPPAPQPAADVEAIAAQLAPDVDDALGDTQPTKDSVRPHVLRLRGKASADLVLAVNRQVKALRAARAEAALS
jgi:hypothetical protein